MSKALGLIEFRSISQGIEAADRMIKAANVTVLSAKTTCPGKFVIMVSGSVEDVRESVNSGITDGKIIGSFLIPNIHDTILDAINGKIDKIPSGAVGSMEFSNISSGITALDAALKYADVKLVKLNLSGGICGKCYFILSGSVSDVEEAVKEAESKAEAGKMLYKTVIPNPARELLEAIL